MKYRNKTITKRTDGRFWARYRKDGKQISVYGRTEKECYEKLKKALRLGYVPTKKAEEQQEYTFFGWLDVWNKTYKKAVNKTDAISSQIEMYIKANFKDKPLKNVTQIELQQIINAVPRPRTRLDVQNILKAAFRRAKIIKIIKEDVAADLETVQYVQKKGEALTLTEETAFLKAIAGTKYEKLFKFYLLTGCRRGEALTVTTRDVNKDNRTLKIWGTKREASERTIPLFKSVEQLLDSIKPDKNSFYFPESENIADSITRAFKKYCKNHKLHDLRHTFATRCLQQKITMKTVQRWLGHTNYNVTANIYSSVQTEFETEQAALLQQYFDTHFDTHF